MTNIGITPRERERESIVACVESCVEALDCLRMHDAVWLVALSIKNECLNRAVLKLSSTKHLELFVTFMSTFEHW